MVYFLEWKVYWLKNVSRALGTERLRQEKGNREREILPQNTERQIWINVNGQLDWVESFLEDQWICMRIFPMRISLGKRICPAYGQHRPVGSWHGWNKRGRRRWSALQIFSLFASWPDVSVLSATPSLLPWSWTIWSCESKQIFVPLSCLHLVFCYMNEKV